MNIRWNPKVFGLNWAQLQSKFWDMLLLLVLFLILEFEYFDFVNIPLFQEKMGFDFQWDLLRYITGKALLLPLILMAVQFKSTAYFLNAILLIFMSFPAIIMFEFMPQTPFIIVGSLIAFHWANYFLRGIEVQWSALKWGINTQKHYLLLTILAFIMVIPILIKNGLPHNFDVLDYHKIYDVRAQMAQHSNRLTIYFFSWLIKIVIPIALVLSMKSKKWFWTILLGILQLYLFMISGQKSAFVALFVVFMMWIKTWEKQIRYLLIITISIILLTKLVSWFSGEIIFESIVVRRTFFLPAIINNYYFDFFAHQPIHWSHSFLRHFIDYPFDLQPPQLIGSQYFDAPKANVNSGFISDGFMNLSYWGIVLNSVVVLGLFKILDSLKISSIFAGVILIIIYTIINSYLPTSFINHGIALFVFLCLFIFRNSALEK